MSAKEIIPWIAVSLVIWNYIQLVVNDSSTLLEFAPLGSFRVNILDVVGINVFKNFILLLHNMIIIFFVFLIFQLNVSLITFTFIYGLFLIGMTAIPVQIIISTLCLRYRDFTQIVQSLLFLIFIMTPIFWKPEILEGRRFFIVKYNLVYHYIETMRSPLLFGKINLESTLIATITSILFILIAWLIHNKTEKKLVYWK